MNSPNNVTYPYRQPCGCIATSPLWVRMCADHAREAELLRESDEPVVSEADAAALARGGVVG